MSDTIAIQTRGLAKSYGDIVAVDHVDLEVATGRVAGLLGPNGAGKTTLMCMLFGLVRPDSGTMRIFGRSVQEDGIAARAGVGGFIETPTFYPYLSGRRNLELLARLDLDPAARRRVPEVLETAGLAERGRDKVGTYSFGMRQRLRIAASLLRKPTLLVVDEPSPGLDPAGIREMRALIKRLAASGITVLVSSHNMLEVEELCDHVTIMRAGSVVFDGSMQQLRRQAPDPAYLMRTSDDAAALAAFGDHRDGAQQTPQGIRFHAGESIVEELARRVVAAGVGIRSLAAQEAPLETLCFQLTDHDGHQVETHHLRTAA